MRRFKNLLVYVQGSPAADVGLARAVTLARANRARLTMLAVLDTDPGEPERADSPVSPEAQPHVATSAQQHRQAELEAHADTLRADDLEVTVQYPRGQPAEAIIRQVVDGNHDLVLKMANPEDSSHHRFIGTTAIQLMRQCPCPVWVVRRQEHPYHRILAAIDAVDIDERRDIDRRVLEIAASMAAIEGGELHVVHAWNALGLGTLGGRVQADEVGEYVRTLHRSVSQGVDNYLRPYLHELGLSMPLKRQLHLPRGAAALRIPEIAVGIGADIVVMGTVARCGLRGYLLGNTAERVLPQVPASVLVVKSQRRSAELHEDASMRLHSPMSRPWVNGDSIPPIGPW